MKTAIVKQVLDVYGPWASRPWHDGKEKQLLDKWPGKISYWEMTCLFKADWYIVPQQINLAYTHESVLQHNREDFVRRHTDGVLALEDIPFSDYDVIITLDPILNITSPSNALVACVANEHWDPIYARALVAPAAGTDLFLAHMLDAQDTVTSLPQAVSFPYPRSPDTVRSLFPASKEEIAFVDWRTLVELGHTTNWSDATDAAVLRLEEALAIPIRYHKFVKDDAPYGISDPPRWGEGTIYYGDLSRSKYFLSVGRDNGAGQALCDAATTGAICFGERNKVYHRTICHPSCLCNDLSELPQRFRTVQGNVGLHSEILEWQDARLHEHFVRRPMAILEKALALKTGRPGEAVACRFEHQKPRR